MSEVALSGERGRESLGVAVGGGGGGGGVGGVRGGMGGVGLDGARDRGAPRQLKRKSVSFTGDEASYQVCGLGHVLLIAAVVWCCCCCCFDSPRVHVDIRGWGFVYFPFDYWGTGI